MKNGNSTFAGNISVTDGTLTLNKSDGSLVKFVYNGTTRGYIGSSRQLFIGGLEADMGYLATGDSVFGAGGAERMRILSSGGITFNGDTAAANALDDYEEGTWTPTNLGSSGFSTAPSSFSGRYTKIGRQVIVSFALAGYSCGTGLKNIVIGGFPFIQHSAAHTET